MVDPQEGGCALGRAGAGEAFGKQVWLECQCFSDVKFPQPKGGKGESGVSEKGRLTAPYSGPAWRGRELASGAEVAENLFFFVASDFNPSMSELVLCLAPL